MFGLVKMWNIILLLFVCWYLWFLVARGTRFFIKCCSLNLCIITVMACCKQWQKTIEEKVCWVDHATICSCPEKISLCFGWYTRAYISRWGESISRWWLVFSSRHLTCRGKVNCFYFMQEWQLRLPDACAHIVSITFGTSAY